MGRRCARQHTHPTAARAAATGRSHQQQHCSSHGGPARRQADSPICRVSPSCSGTPLTPNTTGAWLQQEAAGETGRGRAAAAAARKVGGGIGTCPGTAATGTAAAAATAEGTAAAGRPSSRIWRQTHSRQSRVHRQSTERSAPRATGACLPKLRRAKVTRPNSPWLPSRSSISRLMMLQRQRQWMVSGMSRA